MKNNLLILFMTGFIISAGCSTVKRYASVRYAGEDQSLVTMNLFGYRLYTDNNEGSPRNLWDLNANAQANLLEILDKRYTDNYMFIRSLSNKYLEGSLGVIPPESYIDRDLRLVFSVSRERDFSKIAKSFEAWNPVADRIEYLKFTITLPDSLKIIFTGWNRYSTEYADIDIAGITFNKSFDISPEGSFSESMDNIKRTGNIPALGNISVKEEQKIRYRYLKLNGRINDKQVEIEEEGTRETDLTGNIIIDVSLNLGAFREKVFIPYRLPDEPDDKGKQGSMILQGIDVPVPDIGYAAGAVTADLNMEYVYRHVTGGNKTFQEWDDHVEYYTGKRSGRIILFDRYDYLPPFHTIGTEQPGKKVVMVSTADGKWYSLKFRNYEDACNFQEWLAGYSGNAGNSGKAVVCGDYTLHFDGEPLTGNVLSSNGNLGVLPFY